MIVAHCEDNITSGRRIYPQGKYAKLNGHKGICPKAMGNR